MEEYFKYNPKKYKNKNNQSKLSPQKAKYTSYKDNVLQFSLNAINNILIKNLNSTINIGMLNITSNNINKNIDQIMNKNLYINSLNDCIDYKIKGNIYKISQDNFLHLYPNMNDLITNSISKHKKELKILKFDREILAPQTKTPTKEVPQHFYFNLMKNNELNNNNNSHIKNSKKISSNLEIEQKTKKINNNNNICMYRTSTTVNSKEKNKNINNNINKNTNNNYSRNTYKKKISPVKKYIISKTNANSKENSMEKEREKQKQNIIGNSKHNSPNNLKKELVYKTINNKPRKLIIYTKNKEKEKEKSKNINSIKNKNIHKYIRTDFDLYNKSQSNNSSPKSNNNKNINYNNIEPLKTERNVKYNENKKILYLNNENKNRLLLTPNKYIKNSPKNKPNVFKNKNLNIPYNPTISNNINKISPKNSSPKKKNNLCLQNNLKNNNINKYSNKYYTFNNDNDNDDDNDNENKSRNTYYINKDNNIYDKYKTYEVYNDFSKRNNVFNNDNNNIFKILDNTQIITPDDCGSMQSSSMNSNKLHHFSGSNGNNTNQETDYNSLKKFSDLNGDKNNNYNNIGVYESEENFSFNNL